MQPKTRLALETAFAVIFAAIFVATMFWPDWIELVFGADPDEGNGQFEWAIVAISGLLAIASIIAARMEWRRQHRAGVTITHG
jgi:heme/copper-type cytochrome/quinol oxidase subunit 3